MTDAPIVSPLEPEPKPTKDARSEIDIFRRDTVASCFLRAVLFIVLTVAITYALHWIPARFAAKGAPFSPQVLIAGELLAFSGVFSAAWIMSRLERRKFGDYGLPSAGAFGKLFWVGVLLGATEISVVVGGMAAFGGYHFGSLAVHGGELMRWAAIWALFFLIVGFYEEFLLRGYVQYTLGRGIGFWPAAVLLSAIFGALHITNPGENWAGILGIVLIGLFWCLTLRVNGTLWLAVGMHASFDFGETFVYSVPDSGVVFPGHLSNSTLSGPAWLTGGTAGPEASAFDFLMILLFFLGFYLIYRRNARPGPASTSPRNT
jgi:membrane protease YdiL (CAAX protease family)